MEIGNRFQALAPDPVRRVLRVHQRSIRAAARPAVCHEVAKCDHADSQQCRYVVNSLRREIDRLLRGIDRFAIPCAGIDRISFSIHHSGIDMSNAQAKCDAALELAKLSSPPTARRRYAVAALGAPLAPGVTNSSDKLYASGQSQFHATGSSKLGALFDVVG